MVRLDALSGRAGFCARLRGVGWGRALAAGSTTMGGAEEVYVVELNGICDPGCGLWLLQGCDDWLPPGVSSRGICCGGRHGCGMCLGYSIGDCAGRSDLLAVDAFVS